MRSRLDLVLLLFNFTSVTAVFKKDVFAHYMPWFETPDFNGYWGYHWTMNNKNPDIMLEDDKREIAAHYYPLIGPYASKDHHVLEYHFTLMRAAGITGILIDWYGVAGSNGDIQSLLDNSNTIVDQALWHGIKFAIVLEDRFSRTIEDAKENVEYLKNHYFNMDNYARDENNKPLLLSFGPITFETEQEWSEILEMAGEPVNFLPLWYESGDAGSEASGEYSWVYQTADTNDHEDHIRAFYEHRSLGLNYAGASIYPGFHDFYVEGGGGSSYFYIDYENGQTYRNLIDMALAHEDRVDFLQLITWNDFGEGTMIEPTRERQFESLIELSPLTGGSTDIELYKLIVDLFDARKRGDSMEYINHLLVEIENLMPIFVDEWGNWGAFGECSESCGDGKKVRTRTCNGDTCGEGKSTQSQPCNVEACPLVAEVGFNTNKPWNDDYNDDTSQAFKDLASEIETGLETMLANLGASIRKIIFSRLSRSRRALAEGGNGVTAKVELEIPVAEDKSQEALLESVTTSVNEVISTGGLPADTTETVTVAAVETEKPDDDEKPDDETNDTPCPSSKCWDYNAETSECKMNHKCTTIQCKSTEIIISFLPELFGNELDGIEPAVTADPAEFELHGETVSGHQIVCELGACEMDYGIDNNMLTFDIKVKKGTVGTENLNGITVLMGTRGIEIDFSCEYPTEITLDSNEFALQDVTVHGSTKGSGNLANGFSLSFGNEDMIVLGDVLDVKATWDVTSLEDIKMYFDECGIFHDPQTINVIESGCYSEALRVTPLAQTSNNEIGFQFKTFLVTGASGNDQIVKCKLHLCHENCQNPTEDSSCPDGGDSEYKYSVAGFQP